MARPGLITHRKFHKLCRLLDDRILAMGALELMWTLAYEHGPNVGTPDDLEYALGWRGAKGALAQAILDAGFLDQVGDTLAVHDLYHHAPEYVTRRRQLEAERRHAKTCASCGVEFHSSRANARFCSATCRKAGSRRAAVTGGHALSRQVTLCHASPAPAPALKDLKDQDPPSAAPTVPPPVTVTVTDPVTTPPEPPAQVTTGVTEVTTGVTEVTTGVTRVTTESFDRFYAAYPRHVGRADALKAWRRLKPSDALAEIILAAVEAQKTWGVWDDPAYVPYPATWLRGGHWEDERPAGRVPTNRAPVEHKPWCYHDPPCHHQQEHVGKVLAEMKKAKQVLT